MPEKLTPKQERFCQLIAGGSDQSTAYREAFDSNGKAATVHSEASRLMKLPKITARCDALTALKERALVRSAVTDRQLVTTKLRAWTESGIDPATGEEPTPAQLQAAQLLGRTVALFSDKQIVESNERSAEEVAAEIQRRLEDVQLIEGGSDDNHPLH
jgi:phage terminase small subunit